MTAPDLRAALAEIGEGPLPPRPAILEPFKGGRTFTDERMKERVYGLACEQRLLSLAREVRELRGRVEREQSRECPRCGWKRDGSMTMLRKTEDRVFNGQGRRVCGAKLKRPDIGSNDRCWNLPSIGSDRCHRHGTGKRGGQ